jgi:hypothetical protein
MARAKDTPATPDLAVSDEEIRYSPETAEAALAVDVAEVEFQEAERVWLKAHRQFEQERSAGGIEQPDGTWTRETWAAERMRKLQAAIFTAGVDREETGERLRAARVEHSNRVRADEAAFRAARDVAALKEEGRREREQARDRSRYYAIGRGVLDEIAKKVSGS